MQGHWCIIKKKNPVIISSILTNLFKHTYLDFVVFWLLAPVSAFYHGSWFVTERQVILCKLGISKVRGLWDFKETGLCFYTTVHQLSWRLNSPESPLWTPHVFYLRFPAAPSTQLSACSPTLQNYVSLALIATCATRICNYVSVTISPVVLYTQVSVLLSQWEYEWRVTTVSGF